jgi:ABC-2 type transport system permease protein
MALYPTFKENAGQLNELYQSSKEIVALVGTQDMSTGVGFLTQEVFSIMAPLFLIIYGIQLGASAIGREEGRGTLPLLLANPISRSRVVYEKYAAMKAALLVVAAVVFVTIAPLAPVFEMKDVELAKLATASLMTFLIGLAFGSIAFLVGAATGNRGLAVGATSALGLGMYLLYVMEQLVDSLEPYRWLSLFHYYVPDNVLTDFPTFGNVLVLIGVSVAGFGLSLLVFPRRDVRA